MKYLLYPASENAILKVLIFSSLFILGFSCTKENERVVSSGPTYVDPPVNAMTYDIVVYGGTSAGVIAAVEASKLGKSVALISAVTRIGGMSAGGLSQADIGKPEAVGGLAKDFFTRVGKIYQKNKPVYNYEPKVALQVFNDYIKENKISLFTNERLNLAKGVIKNNNTIIAIEMESGKIFAGKQFIDASYEGDLMAKAGVSYIIGRESSSKYNEPFAGIRAVDQYPISGYVNPGVATSGILPLLVQTQEPAVGSEDKDVMAVNYRIVLTRNTANVVPVQKPVGYDEKQYELLFRFADREAPVFEQQDKKLFMHLGVLPNGKFDANSNGTISTTDYAYVANKYAGGDYATRETIKKTVLDYDMGYLWTLENHPRIPAVIRNFYKGYGLAKDEFTENNNLPTEFYLREGRRMISDFIMTQQVVEGTATAPKPIGMGSYTMDCHSIRYLLGTTGLVEEEGGFFIAVAHPYPISFLSIVPKASECDNLAVPVCISASHVGFTSLRLEPQYMIMAQAAATAASMAIDKATTIQNVDYNSLNKQLLADKQTITP